MAHTTSMGWVVRARSWLWWISEPFRSLSFAVALVGALALPAVVLSAGPMFERSASDEIASRIVGSLDAGPAGLVVDGQGSFESDVLDPLDRELDARFEQMRWLEPAVLTLITDEIELNRNDRTGRPAEIRLLARPGAAEALDVLEAVPGATEPGATEPTAEGVGGAWITATLASETGLRPGDVIPIGADDLAIAGIYRDLWDGTRDAYWDDVPTQFVPRFQRTFDRPDFELVVVDATIMSALGRGGRATWQAPLAQVPPTLAQTRALVADYRRLTSDTIRESSLTEPYLAFTGSPEPKPLNAFTALIDAEADILSVIADLASPIRTTTLAGSAVGLALSTIGAVFAVRRKRVEYRLMAADGDGWWRFFGRAVAQFALPTVVGLVLGVGAGFAIVTSIGPTSIARLDAIDWSDVALAAVVACSLAGVVTAFSAIRLSDELDHEVGQVRGSWLLFAVGSTVAMWVQVARSPTDDVNPLVVAFPFVGILTGVALAVVAFRWVLRRARRTGARLPTPWFLAWRALTASEAGALLLTAAVGVAAGLAVLSATFVFSVDRATNDKVATTVGSNTRLDVLDPPDGVDLPSGTTIVRSQSSTVGDRQIEIVAIDPATFADSVTWPSSFGGSADDLVERLGVPTGDSVPAMVVGGGLPTAGEFGKLRPFPYRIVGSIGSVPLASATGPTLVVRADVFENFARERYDAGQEVVDQVDLDIADTLGEEITYEPALDAFGYTIVSTAPGDDIVELAERDGLRIDGAVRTFDNELAGVSAQSTRWAFDYLGVLAVIGALAALGAMALYLTERRRAIALSTAMTTQMGIGARTSAFSSVIEMVGLVSVSLLAGTVSALVTARRAFPAFEPARDVPPTSGASFDAARLAVVVAVAIASVAAIAVCVQYRSSKSVTAEVLRG
jgi:hypothetical protein